MKKLFIILVLLFSLIQASVAVMLIDRTPDECLIYQNFESATDGADYNKVYTSIVLVGAL